MPKSNNLQIERTLEHVKHNNYNVQYSNNICIFTRIITQLMYFNLKSSVLGNKCHAG